MQLKDDVEQLKAELTQLTLQHLAQQSSLDRQLAEFSAKLDSLSLKLEQQNYGSTPTSSITELTATESSPIAFTTDAHAIASHAALESKTVSHDGTDVDDASSLP